MWQGRQRLEGYKPPSLWHHVAAVEHRYRRLLQGTVVNDKVKVFGGLPCVLLHVLDVLRCSSIPKE
jgi:hypothetical protein